MQFKISEAINSTDMGTKIEAQKTIALQKKLIMVKMNRKEPVKNKDHYGFTKENTVMSSLKR
jgi:hypothetical protein